MTYRLFLTFLLGLSVGSSAVSTHTLANTTGPIVDLGYAKYQGTVNTTTNVTSFLGIRYAAAPTGDLRWNAPQRPQRTSEVQIADKQPAQCFQIPLGINLTSLEGASEDCLFLNVFAPGATTHSKKLLPVIVWIHGGGYVAGNAAQYDGNFLVQESNHGVIVVVIQYRLGLFGFLAGARVKKNGALNAGLLDQEFALKWVQTNIGKFGGDPTLVTIWGESAGAGSVIQHVIAHNGRTMPQLFRGAISSSSYLPAQYVFDDAIPENLFSQVVNQTNCTSANDPLACLRSTNVSSLQAANVQIGLLASPVIDGTFITDSPTKLLQKGLVNGKRLLAVTNTHEGTILVDQSNPNVNVSQYVAGLFPKLGHEEISKVVALYQNLGTPLDQTAAIVGEAELICPSYVLLRAFKGDSFKGEFAVPPGFHGQDILYYFPDIVSLVSQLPPLPFPLPFNNLQFRTTFTHSFLHFATSLDPNSQHEPNNIAPVWKTYDRGDVEMLFNKTEADQPDIRSVSTDDSLSKRCRFWESIAPISGQ